MTRVNVSCMSAIPSLVQGFREARRLPTFHPPIALAAFGDCIEHIIIGQDARVTSECQAVTSDDFDPEFGASCPKIWVK